MDGPQWHQARSVTSDSSRRVVAAVIKRGNTYLVCQRPEHKRHGGLWEFPGGKVHEGESILDAVRRELAEELELYATEVGDVTYRSQDPGSEFIIEFAPTIIAPSEPSLLEHDAAEWKTVAEMLGMALAPSDRQFVLHLASERERAP